MKYLKSSVLLILIAMFSFFVYSCNETTTPTDGPYIDSIEPTSGFVGDIVTIEGVAFGEYNQSTSRVYFGDVMAAIYVDNTEVQWKDDEIKVLVPQGAVTGLVTVEADGKVSNGVNFDIPSAAAPAALMATSFDSASVGLKWTLSADESNSDFTGYKLYINKPGGAKDSANIMKGTNIYIASGLDEGTVYTFDLYALKSVSNKTVMSPKVTITWSPASRFIENVNNAEIRFYESQSLLGSGLQLFNSSGGAPKCLTVATGGTDWDLGLYTTGNTVTFGSAKNILAEYSSFTGIAKTVQISSTTYDVTSLNDVYDSQALEFQSFSEQTFNLATMSATKNLVFVVRTNSPEWNYAKVMVINNGGFLQGNIPNRYVEVIVSYQKVKGVPYAF